MVGHVFAQYTCKDRKISHMFVLIFYHVRDRISLLSVLQIAGELLHELPHDSSVLIFHVTIGMLSLLMVTAMSSFIWALGI